MQYIFLCKKKERWRGRESKKVGGMQWRHKKRRKKVREKIERHKKDGGGGLNSNKKARGGVER